MPISSTEIKWMRSALVSDSTPAQNGGRFTETESVSGVKNNLFPDVTSAQRLAGCEHWRKVFIAIRDSENLTLLDPRVSLEAPTPGDSYALLYAGTQTDVQSGVTGRPYGVGTLAVQASAGATTLTVTAESAAYASMPSKPFQVGDLVRVDARATVLDSGASEYATVATVSYSGSLVTIGLSAGLANTYAAGSKVASAIEPADLAAAVSGYGVTGGVTYDDAGHPATAPALGAIYQTWTITITNAATGAFRLDGDTLGAGVATGAQGADFSPANPAGGTYFTLPAAGWGGTPGTGDTLTLVTAPAAVPVWYRRIVPAGAAAVSSDPIVVCIEGETA